MLAGEDLEPFWREIFAAAAAELGEYPTEALLNAGFKCLRSSAACSPSELSRRPALPHMSHTSRSCTLLFIPPITCRLAMQRGSSLFMKGCCILLNRSQCYQRGSLRLGQSLHPADIEALVGPIASQRRYLPTRSKSFM